ncbi:MAG TPA: hypothetical protein VGJ20_21425 [Xanthobacteraceae bacterium]|jgi:hypothetical protein
MESPSFQIANARIDLLPSGPIRALAASETQTLEESIGASEQGVDSDEKKNDRFYGWRQAPE